MPIKIDKLTTRNRIELRTCGFDTRCPPGLENKEEDASDALVDHNKPEV
jgi:hypothetical protein